MPISSKVTDLHYKNGKIVKFIVNFTTPFLAISKVRFLISQISFMAVSEMKDQPRNDVSAKKL